MQVTVLTFTRCHCGYRNTGLLVGRGRPSMRTLRIDRLFGGDMPWHCRECGYPMCADQPDQHVLHPDSVAALKAWQDRQRAKRKVAV